MSKTLGCAASLIMLGACQSVDAPPDDGKEWQASVRLDAVSKDADRPQVAIDAAGTAIAVWDQTNEGELGSASDDIWSNQRQVGGSWGEAQRLAGIPVRFNDALSPQIAVGGDGSAMVVFLQFDAEGGDYDVWARRHVPNRGWDDPAVPISEEPFDASRPQVAVDDQGNAIAVWERQVSDDEQDIMFNRYRASTGTWNGSRALREGAFSVAPRVGMDAAGNAIALWEEIAEDGVSSIWSRGIAADGSLEPLLNVEAFAASSFDPRIAVDPQGDAVAVWTQQRDDSSGFNAYANRYTASIGDWERQAVSIGPESGGDAQNPQIAVDAVGNAIAVWAQPIDDVTAIWANRFEADIGWTEPAPIGPRSESSARTPQVAMTPDGDAVAVWIQFDGVQDSAWSARYLGGAWRMSRPIEKDDERRAFGPRVAIDSDGDAVAVWVFQDRNGRLAIWSSSLE